MVFGSSKSKSKSLDPQQQAALAEELIASELLMRQFIGGGSVQRNTKHLIEEQQRTAFVPSVPADMQHRSRKSKSFISAQQSFPLPPTTHVIPPSAMPGMPVETVYDGYHHQYVHHHGYPRSEPRRRQTSDSSSSSSSSLTSSPIMTTFVGSQSASYMPYHVSHEAQYEPEVGSGHKSMLKGARGANLKGRAMALFHKH